MTPAVGPSTQSRHLSPHDRTAAVRKVLAIVLALNAVVVAVKIVVGVRTGALTVLGAALESVLDLLNNVIGMVMITVAGREPDEDHPYGHAKFETLGALAIVGFLSISCFELLRVALERLGTDVVPRSADVSEIAMLALTMGFNAAVVLYERRKARQLDSVLLFADAQHTRGDILVTGLALTSLVVTRFGFGYLDPVLAVMVALLIAWSSYSVLRQSVPVLVDERAIDASHFRQLIADIPGVVDVRRVRSRSMPMGLVFAELSVGVDASMSVEQAHLVADRIEARIAERLGGAEVTVHVEPAPAPEDIPKIRA